MQLRRFRRFVGPVSFLAACALAHASSPGTDVTTFSTNVRNFNLITLGNATFTSSNDFQGGLAVEGNLTLDGNTIMGGGGTGYVSSSDPSLYVSGTMTLNGGYSKMNGGYASTPGVGSGWTFATKRLTAPSAYGSGILDSTNSSASQASTSPISNPAPSSWSWSSLATSFAAISSDLAGATTNGTISVSSQNLVLTTTVTSGVAVFTLDMSKFSGNSYNGQALSNVQISPPAGVDYVINVINAAGKTFFPSGVNVNSGSNSGQILWNIVGSGTVTLGGNTIYGSILAPSMNLVTSNTIANGQVVAASFSNSASEIHYTVFVPKAGTTNYTLTVAAGTGGTASGGGSFASGASASISATAGTGYTFSNWTGSGVTNANAASTTVTVNSNETVTANFTMNPPVITSALTASGTAGQAFSYAITATNSPTSYNATGLPTGLSVNTSTGVISGTPTTGGTSNITISATNAGGTGSATLVLTVKYTLTVTAGSGGSASGSGTFTSGTNASISATANSGYSFSGWTGCSGVANTGSASTTVAMTANQSVSANFKMNPPIITSALSDTGVDGSTFSYTITAANFPASYNATGLPAGLVVSTSTGVISGTPTVGGTFNVTISATNAGGTGSATLVLTVDYVLSISASPSGGGFFSGSGIYSPGSTATISETAASGYRNNGWGGPSVSLVASAGSSSTTLPMNANATLYADFTAQGALTVTAQTGGTATGGGTFDDGTTTPITATANTGYVFTGWSGAGVTNVNTAASSVTVSGNQTVTAQFMAATNPEQLGTIVFPNAVASGQAGITPTTSSMTAVVTNSGTVSETVTNITTTGDYSPTVTLPFTLTPGQSQNIPITFAPAALGLRMGLMTGVSNNPTNPVFQFTLEGTGVNPNQPPSATITAPASAYTGSPVYVSSTAFAPMNNLTLHSIEWMSTDGTWNVNATDVSGGNSSRTLGITFPTTGTWSLRAGASTDNGTTWYYSPTVQITITSGLVSYSFESMAVPAASMGNWYSTSPVVSKTYQVQELNPGD